MELNDRENQIATPEELDRFDQLLSESKARREARTSTLKAICTRTLPISIYLLITIITTIQAIFTSSLFTGAVGLLACGLCFWGAAGFAGSFRVRHEKNYTVTQWIVLGAVAAVLVVPGLVLMNWSGFHLTLFGVAIEGQEWAGVGIIVGIISVRKEDVR
jgi:hypothetical protein